MIASARLLHVSFFLATSVLASPLQAVWNIFTEQGNTRVPHLLRGKDGAHDNATRPDPDYAKNFLRYASFGDSWSSGVNYGPPDERLEYNFPNQSEICRCRRVNEAWPVQLRTTVNNVTNETTLPVWTGGRELDLDFVACFASYFEDIPGQIASLNQTYAPEFATLTLGGNPGGFPDLLYNCIFWPDRGKDYGPEYPDPDGECWKAVQRAKETVTSPLFVEGVLRSVALILTEPRIRQNPDFKLYVLGYAELFNPDDEACDQYSFGVWSGKKPLLKRELRKELNGVITIGRRLYDSILNSPLFGDTVRYIDINHLFEGHRFCEKTANNTIEQQNEKSWLYNLEWPACIPIVEEKTTDLHSRTVRERDAHDETWPTFCRKCGALLDYGEFARPFHPKPIAHKAVTQHLIDALSESLRKGSTQPYTDIPGFWAAM